MNRSIFIAIGVLSAAVLAYLLLIQQNTFTVPEQPNLLFPELEANINEVAEITISSNESSFSIVSEEADWGVEEHAFYPAQFNVVRKFLLGFSQLRILAKKTNDPQKHSILELAGTDVEDSPTVRVSLKSKHGDEIAALFVGKQQISSEM